MARMTQAEIDEISDAFGEAWTDFFGTEMYYIPFDDSVQPTSIYNESRTKRYLEDQKILFHGTFKEEPKEEIGEIGGRRERQESNITFVTKEMVDQGVNYIDTRSIIRVIDRHGTTTEYNIIEVFRKVQLVDNHIFTKMKVVDKNA